MIIVFRHGQLGNQLFQYCAMRKFQPHGKIISVGMAEITSSIKGLEMRNLELKRLVATILKRVVEFIAQSLRLISFVEEKANETGSTFSVARGLITNIVYFKKGYYQAEKIVMPKIVEPLSVRPEFNDRAKEILEAFPCQPGDRFFVHVRRGDYLRWPSPDAPAVLPLCWYRTQIERIYQFRPGAFFFVLSDDWVYADEFFSREPRAAVIHNDVGVDFAIMTQCLGGGILSASSLSWWGAFFARRANPNGLFIAPKYWAGHRTQKWIPKSIPTSWINYVE